MKPFLKNGLLFLLAFSVIYVALFAALCVVEVGGTPIIYRAGQALNWKGGNSYHKFRDFDDSRSYDILFIGSSHAYRGYDMSVFKEAGLEVFNLGSSAQTPMNSRWILNDLIDEGTTRMVVMDVFNGALETDGLECTADLTQNYPSFAPVFRMVRDLKDPRGLNMLLLRLLRSGSDPMYTEECNGVNGSCLIPDSLGTTSYPVDRPLELNQMQLNALKQTVQEMVQKGVDVLWVDHPVPPDSDIKRQRRYATIIDSLSREWGVPLLDMSMESGFDSEDHFYDHTHLNKAGATLFSKKLISRMREDGYL